MSDYDADEIFQTISSENQGFVVEDESSILKSLGSICSTVNEDLEMAVMRQYSHNVIGLSLSNISSKTSFAVANRVIELIPEIDFLYKISPVEGQ